MRVLPVRFGSSGTCLRPFDAMEYGEHALVSVAVYWFFEVVFFAYVNDAFVGLVSAEMRLFWKKWSCVLEDSPRCFMGYCLNSLVSFWR
jgi:hypothetical protein